MRGRDVGAATRVMPISGETLHSRSAPIATPRRGRNPPFEVETTRGGTRFAKATAPEQRYPSVVIVLRETGLAQSRTH